jgi:stalled ribosome rescue protein Dom34
MQTKKSINGILMNIQYKDWMFIVDERDDCFTLQIQFDEECIVTGEVERQYCRKWFLSKHMTNNEIVRTAFMAVEKAEFHELCEKFRYMGQLINNPHIDLIKVASGVVDFHNLDHR